jgi:hypothetical protein
MAFVGVLFLIMFFVTAVVIVSLAISGFKNASRQDVTRLNGAKKIGLVVDSNRLDPKNMSGKIQGFEVKVERSLNTETVKIRYPKALGIGLCLTHQSYYDRAARWLGNQDIEVGDEEFDRRVVVQGEPQQVVPFLNEKRRTKILELFDLDDAFMIMDRGISLKNVGRPLPPEDLSEHLKMMVEVGTVLTQNVRSDSRNKKKKKPASPPPRPEVTKAPEAEKLSEKEEFYEEYKEVLQDALSLARQQAATGKVTGRNAQLLVSAIMVANRDFEGAAKLLSKLKEAGPVKWQPPSEQEESLLTNPLPVSTSPALVEKAEPTEPAEEWPSDKVETAIEERAGNDTETSIEERVPEKTKVEDVQETTEPVESKGDTVESAEETVEDEEQERASEESEVVAEVASDDGEVKDEAEEKRELAHTGPDATSLCKELFSTLSSRAAVKKFEEEIADAEVCWSGTLQRIETFITDRIFDQDTELVAVFSMVDPEDKYATRLGDALVSFPKEAEGNLRPHIGQMMEFTGKLFQLKPFMRTLYLRDGDIAVEAN